MTLDRAGAARLCTADADETAKAANCDAARERVRELYREHSPALVRQLTRRTRSAELARDLTQEAFVNVLRITPGMLAGIREPEAFLRRIGTNLLRDWARSRDVAERARPALELSADRSLDQVGLLEARDTLRRLEQAIGRLRPKTREIFLAHRIDGLTYVEIADRTGLSIKGVEKQMAKAIAKIDRLLDRD
jgi:RNA polymerase sigma-70 factor (ECF subfamily)